MSMTEVLVIDKRAKSESLRAALYARDPLRVAAALDLPPPVKKGDVKKSNSTTRYNNNNETSLQGPDGVEWGSILTSLLEASDATIHADHGRCYDAHSSLHAGLNHIFSTSSGNWLVPALHTVCRNTARTAVLADEQAAVSGGKNDHAKLQNAVTLLQDSFSKTLNDRTEYKPDAPLNEEGSKKAGVLFIVNQLFSMYFRLNTLRLCKNLLRPVESRKLHEKSDKMGDMVTYRYYVGRLNMFEDQYELAESNLDFALLHCHRNAVANKKRILKFLLPVKLLRGRLPTSKLLEKYGLHEFSPLVDGIRKGDLRTFNDGLAKYQDLFIRRGTYLLLEKCKTVCYRNLFKRTFAIVERHQIPLDSVVKAFKWLGVPIDLDEVECILANLIYRGHVRGYISHAKRVLVLSKRDPFPLAAIVAK